MDAFPKLVSNTFLPLRSFSLKEEDNMGPAEGPRPYSREDIVHRDLWIIICSSCNVLKAEWMIKNIFISFSTMIDQLYIQYKEHAAHYISSCWKHTKTHHWARCAYLNSTQTWYLSNLFQHQIFQSLEKWKRISYMISVIFLPQTRFVG